MFRLKVAHIVKLVAILFMLIRWSKRQNSAWEQGKSNSAYPNYAKKCGPQLLLRKACRLLHRPFFLSRNGSSLQWAEPFHMFVTAHKGRTDLSCVANTNFGVRSQGLYTFGVCNELDWSHNRILKKQIGANIYKHR